MDETGKFMKKRCIYQALIALAFVFCLYAGVRGQPERQKGPSAAGQAGTEEPAQEADAQKPVLSADAAPGQQSGVFGNEHMSDTEAAREKTDASGDGGAEEPGGQKAGETAPEADEQKAAIPDLTAEFDMILGNAAREFTAGYTIDKTFLMWLAAQYGEHVIRMLADCAGAKAQDPEAWYELTGNSLHVLWLRFCQDTGFQDYRLEHVFWKEAGDPDRIVLGFAGAVNVGAGSRTMEYLRTRQGGVYDCFSGALTGELQAADILQISSEPGELAAAGETAAGERPSENTSEGERQVVRAKAVELLQVMGTDVAVLADNREDRTNASELVQVCREAGIPYTGMPDGQGEAVETVYFVINGRKIAYVTAAEPPGRTAADVQEEGSGGEHPPAAGDRAQSPCGVYKLADAGRFCQLIASAAAVSDYVIATAQWGMDGAMYPDETQRSLPEAMAAAGADVIIGGHPHRLQGVGYTDGVPVLYSLGNFWFSDSTLYTALARVVISKESGLQVNYLPCIQTGFVTDLITDETEKESYFRYLAAISGDIGIDAWGNIYEKAAADYPAEQIVHDPDASVTELRGAGDRYGEPIDAAGNLKERKERITE